MDEGASGMPYRRNREAKTNNNKWDAGSPTSPCINKRPILQLQSNCRSIASPERSPRNTWSSLPQNQNMMGIWGSDLGNVAMLYFMLRRWDLVRANSLILCWIYTLTTFKQRTDYVEVLNSDIHKFVNYKDNMASICSLESNAFLWLFLATTQTNQVWTQYT